MIRGMICLGQTLFAGSPQTAGLLRVTRRLSGGITEQGCRLFVEVEAADGVDQNVFLYERVVNDPETGEYSDHFVHLCTPNDLVEWPTDSPNAELALPRFRLNHIDLLFRSVALRDDTWDLLKDDLSSLARSLASINAMGDIQTYDFTF